MAGRRPMIVIYDTPQPSKVRFTKQCVQSDSWSMRYKHLSNLREILCFGVYTTMHLKSTEREQMLESLGNIGEGICLGTEFEYSELSFKLKIFISSMASREQHVSRPFLQNSMTTRTKNVI